MESYFKNGRERCGTYFRRVVETAGVLLGLKMKEKHKLSASIGTFISHQVITEGKFAGVTRWDSGSGTEHCPKLVSK